MTPEEAKAIKDLVEKHGNVQAAFIEKNDKRVGLLEAGKHAPADLVQEVKDISALLTKTEGEIREEVKKIQVAINRSAKLGENEDKPCEKQIASELYIRKDIGALTPEQKALITSNDPQAGYAVSDVQGDMFDETIKEFSPMMQLASVVNITKGDRMRMRINKKGGTGAKWTNQTTPVAETGAPSLGELFINVHPCDATSLASIEQLEDSDFGIENWLRTESDEDLASLINASFYTGTGVEESFGFLNYADGLGSDRSIDIINSGDATNFTRDGIVRLSRGIKKAYRSGASFQATPESITEIRLLKDSTGRYSLINDFSKGVSTTLLGYPLLDAVDMPDFAANAHALAFGNWSRAYQVVVRKGLTLRRFNEAFNPYIGFNYSKRIGGDLRVAEAIVVQKIAA